MRALPHTCGSYSWLGSCRLWLSLRSAGYRMRRDTRCRFSRCKQSRQLQHLHLFTFSTGEQRSNKALSVDPQPSFQTVSLPWRYAVIVPSWTEVVIFVVIAALLILLIWHFPKMHRRK